MGQNKARVGRNFTFVVYPDSAYPDWLTRLDDKCIEAFVSPLHDLDKNPDGSNKKAHYHVVLMFSGNKTLKVVNEIFQDVVGEKGFVGNGAQFVDSLRGMCRYLVHLDNPDKHRYDERDVIALCGAHYNGIIESASSRYSTISDMTQYICDNQIFSFARFFDYCREYNSIWFEALCDNSAYIIKEYIRDFKFTEKELD